MKEEKIFRQFFWLHADDFSSFLSSCHLPLLALVKVYRRKKKKKEKEREQNHFFLHPKAPSPHPLFSFSISLLCSSRFLHLSVLGWMNSSIQRHYYAERGAEGRIGKRGGGWRWGKSCGCWTPCKSLPSEPFNSLYSKVKSLSGKPMSNWKYMCVTAYSVPVWQFMLRCVHVCVFYKQL